ncbi:MAG: DNA-3-methyladenine glycosylase I [Bradymonadaceae bacterium]|nr:DNA-3-methyladenine glycosylase I [Lujinxingiaceae bacterium]
MRVTLHRCPWCTNDALYQAYHDREWGFPVADDRRLFEKLCLEGFQSGLSWLTILRKRENFRAAFDDFDFERVAGYDADDVERLMNDAGIVRNRQKIDATINNAQRALELIDEVGSLAAYFWQFEPAADERPEEITWPVLLALPNSPTSKRLAKDLKHRGFRFVGPTTAYAFMQAMGIVNDHIEGCAIRPRVEQARLEFSRPKPRDQAL